MPVQGRIARGVIQPNQASSREREKHAHALARERLRKAKNTISKVPRPSRILWDGDGGSFLESGKFTFPHWIDANLRGFDVYIVKLVALIQLQPQNCVYTTTVQLTSRLLIQQGTHQGHRHSVLPLEHGSLLKYSCILHKTYDADGEGAASVLLY